MSGGFPESPHIPGVHAKTNYNGFGKPVVPDPSSPNSIGGDARPNFQDQINALQTAVNLAQYNIGQLQGLSSGLSSALQELSGDVADVKGRVADNIAAITTSDADSEATTQALANELKSVVNLILTKLKLANLMEDDE